jgi:hypothetical protein
VRLAGQQSRLRSPLREDRLSRAARGPVPWAASSTSRDEVGRVVVDCQISDQRQLQSPQSRRETPVRGIGNVQRHWCLQDGEGDWQPDREPRGNITPAWLI